MARAPIPASGLEALRDSIPKAMIRSPQWVYWRAAESGGHWQAAPVQANGQAASASEPSTWRSFQDNLHAGDCRHLSDGVGFIITADDRFCVLALDDCRDRETGEIARWTRDLAARVDTYTEINASGRGLTLFCRARLAASTQCADLPWHGAEGGRVTIHDRGMCSPVTGLHLPGTPSRLASRQRLVGRVQAELGLPTEQKPRRSRRQQPSATCRMSADDRHLIDRAKRAANGPKFTRLWEGDASLYGGDRRRASLALAFLLVFWCDHDGERAERLLRQSGLHRHGQPAGSSHLREVVLRALAHVQPGYQPRPGWRKRRRRVNAETAGCH